MESYGTLAVYAYTSDARLPVVGALGQLRVPTESWHRSAQTGAAILPPSESPHRPDLKVSPQGRKLPFPL